MKTRSLSQSILYQVLLFLFFALILSVPPLATGLLLDKSNYYLALLHAWYGIFPPVILLLAVAFIYRREENRVAFWGRLWMGVGCWFLLQFVLNGLVGILPPATVLENPAALASAILSLPSTLEGGIFARHPEGEIMLWKGWSYVIALILFLAGGIFLYYMGHRRKLNSDGHDTPKRPVIKVLLVLLACLMPLIPLIFLTGPGAEGEKNDIPAEEEIFAYIEDIYNFGARRAGTSAYEESLDYIVNQMEVLGYDTIVERTSFDFWEEKKWNLVVHPDTDDALKMESFYLPYTGPTKPGGITTEIVCLGEGTAEEFYEKDVEGKIALIELPATIISWDELKIFSYFAYDPDNTAAEYRQPYPIGWLAPFLEVYPRLEEHGAAGAIFILQDYPDLGPLSYYAPYDGVLRPVPCLYIREEDGNIIKEELGEGKVEVTLTLEAETSRRTAANAYAILPGRSEANYVISSHFDSPWASAVEDSSGVGLVLALAEYYAQLPEAERERTLVFLFTGSHMVGEPTNYDFIERHEEDLLADMLYYICLEHVADNYPYSNYVEPRGIFIQENPVVASLLAKQLEKYNLYRTVMFPTGTPLGVPSDAGPKARQGYPVISLISGPVYLFDAADTLERVPRDQLVPLSAAFIELIEELNRYPEFLLRFRVNTVAILLVVFLFTPLALFGFQGRND